jgi:hypothetical protein
MPEAMKGGKMWPSGKRMQKSYLIKELI